MRASDRLITPGVVIAFLIVGGLVAGGTIGGVTYLAGQGQDPEPLVRLVLAIVGALGGLGTFVMQLADRAQKGRIERNTGELAAGVGQVVAELDATRPAAAPLDYSPPATSAAAVPAGYGLVAR